MCVCVCEHNIHTYICLFSHTTYVRIAWWSNVRPPFKGGACNTHTHTHTHTHTYTFTHAHTHTHTHIHIHTHTHTYVLLDDLMSVRHLKAGLALQHAYSIRISSLRYLQFHTNQLVAVYVMCVCVCVYIRVCIYVCCCGNTRVCVYVCVCVCTGGNVVVSTHT